MARSIRGASAPRLLFAALQCRGFCFFWHLSLGSHFHITPSAVARLPARSTKAAALKRRE
jgi:hypothetical protein